jgi:penicillin-binding protein 2
MKFLGIDKIRSYGDLFGLNKETGVDLPGEKTGFLPTMKWKEEVKGEPWYIGDTYHAAIGQGDILATPLQMANYYGAIVNGGTLYKPHLVKEIKYIGDNKTDEIKPEIIRQGFIDSKNLEIVRRGMRQTVLAGSAQSLQLVPMEVAGKTGTAQSEGNKGNHAWFAGFAPYKDPQIAIIVLVENGGEGSSVAVPIARDIFTWYYQNRILNSYQVKKL